MVAPSKPLVGDKGGDKAVMGAIRQKKTGKQAENVKLTMDQIILSNIKKEAPDQDPQRLFNVMKYMVNQKKGKFIQIGNTVIVATPTSPDVAEIHTFTVEPPETIAKRYKSAANTLKQLGFKKVISYAQSPAFVKIAQNSGLPVKVNQSQQMIGNKMVPAYKFELDL